MNGSGKILVVEDDKDVCDAVSDSLTDAGYEVSNAPNGAAAMSVLHAMNELPCLILLDLMMPVMDGADFLREIRGHERLATVPVVLLTADGAASTKAVALGAAGGLRKPVDLDDLLAAVSEHRAAVGQ